MSTGLALTARELAMRCHALADETRLKIIDLLSEGERCVCELTEELHTSQSRLSFHLKTLKEAGLVRDRRDGRWNYYELDWDAFELLREYVMGLKEARRSLVKSRKACD